MHGGGGEMLATGAMTASEVTAEGKLTRRSRLLVILIRSSSIVHDDEKR